MKKIIFLLAIFGLIIVAIALVFVGPFHFYNEVLENGLDSPFLSLEKKSKVFHKGGPYRMVKMTGLYGEEEQYWKKFHFSHFEIPFPVRNPIYRITPIIEKKFWGEELGLQYRNPQGKLIGEFRIQNVFDFKFNFNKNKIFELPFFKRRILKRNNEQLWKDIFTKDIQLPKFDTSKLSKSIETYKEISYDRMVYNLFILNMRSLIFTKDIKELSWLGSKKFGIVEMVSEAKKKDKMELYREEVIYLLLQGKIYSIRLKTRLNDIVAEALRKRLINNIEYRTSTEDSSISIYEELKVLPVARKREQEGLIYFFSAWTHKMKDVLFLKQMIRYLEKVKELRKPLRPFYDYAYRTFKSNFSKEGDLLLETEQEKLKRKMEEELETEVQNAKKEIDVESNTAFENEDEKVKYFLQKAKDEGNNSDEDDKVLSID